jgi:hypothetical protein
VTAWFASTFETFRAMAARGVAVLDAAPVNAMAGFAVLDES